MDTFTGLAELGVGKGAGFHTAIDCFLRYPQESCRLVDIEDISVFKLRGSRLDEVGLLRLTSLAWWHGYVLVGGSSWYIRGRYCPSMWQYVETSAILTDNTREDKVSF